MASYLNKKDTKLLKSLKSLVIIGREWFDNPNGNTYHSTLLSINNKPFIFLPIAYGGADQYIKTALDYLKEKNILPNQSISLYNLYTLEKKHNIKILYTVSTVTTKKQLKRWY